jgi:hypothetical protein
MSTREAEQRDVLFLSRRKLPPQVGDSYGQLESVSAGELPFRRGR